MVAELLAVAEFLEEDREIGAVMLRGAGGVFCAGGDIKGFKASFETPKPKRGKPDPIAVNNRRFGKFLARFNGLPQTVIAAVEGAAIAGGLGLMSVADVVIATADAKFALTGNEPGHSAGADRAFCRRPHRRAEGAVSRAHRRPLRGA